MPQVIFMDSGCRPFLFFCDAAGEAITSQEVGEDAGTCTVRVRLAPAVYDPAFACFGGAAAAYTPAPWPVTVQYAVEAWTPNTGGTLSAVAGTDFVAATGALTWAPGDVEKTITINIAGAADGFHSHWDKNQIAVRLHTAVGAQISATNPLPVLLVDNEPEDPQYILGTAEAEHTRVFGDNAITGSVTLAGRFGCDMADSTEYARNGFGITLPLLSTADGGHRYLYRRYETTTGGTTYEQIFQVNKWMPYWDGLNPAAGWPPAPYDADGGFDRYDDDYFSGEWFSALDTANLATTLGRTATTTTESFTGIAAGAHTGTTLDGTASAEYTTTAFETDFDDLWAAAEVRGGYQGVFFYRPWSNYGEVEAADVGVAIDPIRSPGTPTANTAAVTLLFPCDGDGVATAAIPSTMTAPGLTATLDADGLATSVVVDTPGQNVFWGNWLAELPGGIRQIISLETVRPSYTFAGGSYTADSPADGTIADTAVSLLFMGAGEVIASHESRSVGGAVVWRKKKAAEIGSTGTWIHVQTPVKVECRLDVYDWANTLLSTSTVDITETASYPVDAPVAEGYITATLILTPQTPVSTPGHATYP